MSINKKTILACVLASLCGLAVAYLLINQIMLDRILKWEQQALAEDIERVKSIIMYDVSNLGKFAEDWAKWDDTYLFISSIDKESREDYIEKNLNDDTFKSQRINFIIFADSRGNIVYSKWYDFEQGRAVPESTGFDAQIYRQLAEVDVENVHSGLIRVQNDIMLVAAMPVTDSQRQRPANGMLIVGRQLDDLEIAKLSGLTHLAFGVTLSESAAGTEPVYSYNRHMIEGTAHLDDIAGNTGFVLKVKKTRDIYKQGLRMIYSVMAALFFATLVLSILSYFLFKAYVVDRLAALTKSIANIKNLSDVDPGLEMKGNDEISALSAKIRIMLEELRASYEQQYYLSMHDPLTGAYNRTYYEKYLRQLIHNPHAKVGVLVCDLDGLKLVNDMFGHECGDEMLKEFVAILKESCPEDSVIARIGGDEFIVFIKENSQIVLKSLSETIKQNIHGWNLKAAKGLSLSVSIGFDSNEGKKQNIRDIIKSADRLMYREKLHSAQSKRSGLVNILRSALEARDYITEGHASRMSELTVDLARRIGVQQQIIPDLQLFAEFHDVGKIGIPDSILFKNGALTADERLEMQKHCEIGYRIAQSTPDLAPIADLILKHHEWYDGTGYPMGLMGKEIPLECRILAIVDAYDAMTNDRPYRAAMSCSEAVSELEKFAGRQFDPGLVAEFINMLRVKGLLRS